MRRTAGAAIRRRVPKRGRRRRDKRGGRASMAAGHFLGVRRGVSSVRFVWVAAILSGFNLSGEKVGRRFALAVFGFDD